MGTDVNIEFIDKVIKGLKCLITDDVPCDGCPYNGCGYCIKSIASDALSVVKEPEAVEPDFKQDEKGIFVWCCGSCGADMYHIYDGVDKAKEYAKFCRQCGKPVLWEGR